MFRFIFRRSLYGLLVLFGVSIVVFFIFHLLPGDPVSLMMGQRTDEKTKLAIEKELGLNEPTHKQLFFYLNDLSPLSFHEDTPENAGKYSYVRVVDFGDYVFTAKVPYMRRSFQSNRLVSEILVENFFEGTLWLTVAAMIIATVFGLFFGIIASIKHNSWLDNVMVSLSVFGISAPSYVMGTIIALVFAVYLGEYTGFKLTGQLWVSTIEGTKFEIKNLVLPAITLGIRPLAIITQMTRSSMLEVLSQDYIRTARAKGLKFRKIITKHALKNALNPVITAISGWFASLLAGAYFVEIIFNLKGLGQKTIEAVNNLDFPVVMGSTLFVAFLFVFINILVDILYAYFDPRVRLE